MRIRKRKVPLPIELLSPIPISSDPRLFTRSSVTLVQPESTHHHGNNSNSQPSDHLTSSDLNRSIDDGNCSSDHFHGCMMNKSDPLVKEQVPQLVGCLGFGGNDSMLRSNDASIKSITALGAATHSTISNGPSLSSNPQEKPMWCDENKGVPLKKRRGSTEQTNAKSSENNVKKIKDSKNDDDNDSTDNNGANISGNKGIKRGKTILEGSKCSRVNGRGWRCCQPTLVGYSLCEHHLGKGRLRSMSSVRGRPLSMTPKKTALRKLSIDDCSPLMQLCEAAKKESDEMLVGKGGKLGVVKARSLSSLLGRTDTTSLGIASATEVVDEKGSKVVNK